MAECEICGELTLGAGICLNCKENATDIGIDILRDRARKAKGVLNNGN